MWIFTKDGFFSVVQKPHQRKNNMVTVRGRDKKDLQRFIKAAGLQPSTLIDNEGTDYEFRVEVDKDTWKIYLDGLVDGINYDNFKHEVQLNNAERARVYMDVWSALLKIADRTARKFFTLDPCDERTNFNNYNERPARRGYFDDGGIWHYYDKSKRRNPKKK